MTENWSLMSNLALIFLQMQIPCHSDGDIFLVSIILCTDSDNHAFETKIIELFHDKCKEIDNYFNNSHQRDENIFDWTYFS